MNEPKKPLPPAPISFAVGCVTIALFFGLFAPLVVGLWKWALR